jgi:hypothetical protein
VCEGGKRARGEVHGFRRSEVKVSALLRRRHDKDELPRRAPMEMGMHQFLLV